MKLTSLESFVEYVMTGYKIGFENLNFYRGSRKFGCIQAYEGLVGEPIIGPSLHDVLKHPDHQSLFFYFKTKEYDHVQSFSLLDANVIPNHYNDWYFFTTPEEAKQWVNPVDHVAEAREAINSRVTGPIHFEENVRRMARTNKIEAIKLVRSVAPISLLQAKCYVEALIDYK